MVKIIMHGCNGAMGQVITKLAAEDKDAEITAGIDRVDNRENPYPVFESVEACDVPVDVVIDFSNAAAVDGIIDRIEEELGQKVTVIATGGKSRKIIPHCKRKMIQDGDLLLKGLQIVYEKNKA